MPALLPMRPYLTHLSWLAIALATPTWPAMAPFGPLGDPPLAGSQGPQAPQATQRSDGTRSQAPLATAPGQAAEELDPAVQERLQHLLPGNDGWVEEVWNDALHDRLVQLEAAIAQASEASAALPAFVSPELVCRLRPATETAQRGRAFEVRRARTSDGGEPLGFAEALSELRAPFGSDTPEVHFKVLHVRPTEGGLTTEWLYSADSTGLQQRARWSCRWEGSESATDLRLVEISVSDYEEVERVGAGALFADCSEALFAREPSWRDQLLPGLPHWRARMDASLGVSLLGHQGVAVGDFDGDGREDLYVCQPGGLPNRLYRHRPDGAAEDVAAAAGLDFLDASRSALWLDLDDDGDADLVLAFFHELAVFENDGRGRFSERALLPLPTVTSIAAADVDLDGDLDLYGCSYVAPYDDSVAPTPYHDAQNGQPNSLYRNEGDWRFADVTDEVGLNVNNTRFSFAASFEDIDNDGDPDLYVANDFGRNNLYRNDVFASEPDDPEPAGGKSGTAHFVDIAESAGVEDLSAGMGVTFSDVDRDGFFDVYVSNMFSSAGNRVAYSRRFQEGAAESDRSGFQRHARGNSLFLSKGDGTFRDASVESGVTMGRWAWGALFSDFDNDGRDDLIVPNGFVTGRGDFDDL